MRTAIAMPRTVPVGREVELSHAEQLLADSTTRLITFTGPRGVGKTCVALDVAERAVTVRPGALDVLQGRVPLLVDVHGVTAYDELLQAVSAALGISSSTGALEQDLAAHEALVNGVVVLDGCDDMAEEPHPVRRLLWLLEDVRVLATGGTPLEVGGEHVIALDPLAVPAPGDGAALAESAAVRLFCDRAAEVDPWSPPTDADLPTIAALCRRVHGLPLGIELLASRVRAHPVAEILESLGGDVEVAAPRAAEDGEDGEPGVDDGADNAVDAVVVESPPNLRPALEWSYGRLDASSAALLRRMSVFETPATLDMLACVMAAVGSGPRLSLPELLDVVGDLVDHRLVEPYDGPGEPAFALIDLVRDFASEQLIDAGEWGPVGDAHGRALVEFAVARGAALEAASADVAMRELARSERDLRTALRNASSASDLTDGIRLAAAVAPYVLRRGYDGLVGADLGTMLARAASARVPDVVLAQGMLWSARLATVFGGPRERELVVSRLDIGVGRARAAEHRDTLLLGLSFVVLALPATGDVVGVRAAAAEGLELAEKASDPRWAARFCGWSGLVAHQAGDVERAVALARRGLDHSASFDDPRARMVLAMLVGSLSPEAADDLPARLPSTDELLTTARLLHEWRYESYLLRVAAGRALTRGNLRAAAAHIGDGLRLVQRQESWPDLPFSTLNVVVLAFRRGDYTEGARFFGTISYRMEELRAAVPPRIATEYVAAIEDAKAALGGAEFSALGLEGEYLAHRDRVSSQIAYADRAAGRQPRPRSGPTERVPTQRLAPVDSPYVSSDTALTRIESDLFGMVVAGAGSAQIAEQLDLAPAALVLHTSAVYRKLGVRGRAEAAALVHRRGLAH